MALDSRDGSRIFEKGVHLRSTSQKKGGSRTGSNFGPNVKKPISWPRKGGPDPPPPVYVCMYVCMCVYVCV